MDRRTVLSFALAVGAAPLWAACGRREGRSSPVPGASGMSANPSPDRRAMPAVFIAHGSPLLLDDVGWVAELEEWARAMPRPSSVLMISAHWEHAPVTLGATRRVPLVYDFYGFRKKYYEVTYAAPGAPELARRVRELLAPSGPVADDPERGLDHGAYVPLIAMYPDASVPVLQISIPTMDPAPLVALGRKLAPLRQEGVLIAGSGFLTHNMRALDWAEASTPPSWAAEFDAWAKDALARRDVDGLVDYRAKAPGVRDALPTHEHFVPVLVALGASIDAPDEVAFPITGFAYGSFTKRSVQFG
jgi:4,5-DOPA dioxygenase extradiol